MQRHAPPPEHRTAEPTEVEVVLETYDPARGWVRPLLGWRRGTASSQRVSATPGAAVLRLLARLRRERRRLADLFAHPSSRVSAHASRSWAALDTALAELSELARALGDCEAAGRGQERAGGGR